MKIEKSKLGAFNPFVGGGLLTMFVGGAFAVWYLFFRKVEPKSMPYVLPTTAGSFVKTMHEAVAQADASLSNTTVAMVIAHAAYESGWGKAVAFKQANNPFNLTTTSNDYVPGPDQECDASGVCKPIKQRWARYADLASGVRGYFAFIQGRRYTDSYNRLVSGDVGFIDSLRAGGYFTLPLETYKKNYLSVLSRVKKEMGL